MNDIGWIKIHRKLLDWEWYKDVNTFKLFLHLLLKANVEEKKWQGYTIKRGQLITSLKNMSNETGLTEKEVRTALNKLEKTNEVGKQTTSVNTTLTMINYDLYQSMGIPKGKVGANEGQSRGKVGATTKELEEYKELKEDIESLFETFWNLYDKKVERKNCLAKFKKLDIETINKIIQVVPDYVKSTPDPKYRKNPETWINGECWNDEIAKPEKKEEGYTLANGTKMSTNFAF